VSPQKKEIIALLEKKAYDVLARRSRTDRKIISVLISLSYDKNSHTSWRAVEAIGLATKEMSVTDPEAVRNFAGRLLWMIRDESGGIGWSAPEILGEIVRNNPVLCSDFAPIIASFHDEIMLCAGVLRALGRIGPINPETVSYAAPIVRSYLRSENETLRGYAAWTSGEMGTEEALADLEILKNDPGRIRFYENGELVEKKIGEIVSAAIEKIRRG